MSLAWLCRFQVVYPHLDVHIFESASAFKEAGLAIGVTRNAQAALDLMGPQASQLLKRAGAVPMRGARFMIAQGEGQGQVINEVDDASTGKRLTSIKLGSIDRNPDGSITLHFTDGTAHEFDILVGADGIRTRPRNTGLWIVMTLQPYAKARASLGQGLVDSENAREYSWVGNGSYIMHNVLSDGQLVQFVIGSSDHGAESSDSWHRTVSADEIKKLYVDWPPHLKQAVEELLCLEDEHDAIYLWEHPPARSYVSGPLCVMGDAAHATTPWQGSGGGMSIEDSLVLSTLLGGAKTPIEAQAALKAYDQVRRPRTQRIVESSRDTGTMLIGRGAQTGFEMKQLGNLLPRWDFILDIDMLEHRNEAIRKMQDELVASA
ncbi:salicylate hydroxylase [Xylariaceae sp. AK1471]|nr:salicylate hydroxylase [Xylariaceae sp. AK1471]